MSSENEDRKPAAIMNAEVKGYRLFIREDKSYNVRTLTLLWILLFFFSHDLHFSVSCADENNPLSEIQNGEVMEEIVNPFIPTCYDWSGDIIPCYYKKTPAELLPENPIPSPRFVDNKNGTVTDNLTDLVWLKRTDCFKKMDWESAVHAVRSLKDGDCGPDPSLVLSDGSSSGDWRLPKMKELCTLIDYSKRNPALPDEHKFLVVPGGYHWSATKLDYYSGMAWIVYIESGTTCYENVNNRAGHIWPVRNRKK